MDKQGEARRLADELLADIELNRIDAQRAVLKATRLARLTNHEDGLTWLSYELNGYPKDAPTGLLKRCGRESIVDGETLYYFGPLSQIESHLAAQRALIAGMQVTSISSDYAATALREQRAALTRAATSLAKHTHIPDAVRAAIHEFASHAYHELTFGEIQAELFATVRADVDGKLAPLSGDLLKMIESINDRLRAGEREAISHAMTTCRRLIKPGSTDRVSRRGGVG